MHTILRNNHSIKTHL